MRGGSKALIRYGCIFPSVFDGGIPSGLALFLGTLAGLTLCRGAPADSPSESNGLLIQRSRTVGRFFIAVLANIACHLNLEPIWPCGFTLKLPIRSDLSLAVQKARIQFQHWRSRSCLMLCMFASNRTGCDHSRGRVIRRNHHRGIRTGSSNK